MPLSRPDYVRRVLIAVGLAGLAAVLFVAAQPLVRVLLLLFGGILLAVLLDGLARLLARHSPLGRGLALALVVVVIAGATVAAGWLMGPKIADQFGELTRELPEAIDRAERWLNQFAWGSAVTERVPESAEGAMPEGESGLGLVQSAFSTVAGILTDALIVLFVGLFLAINPGLYVGGLVRLVPPRGRDRAREVFGALGSALRSWLLGRIVSMAIVGALTAVGLMVFGIPLALTLGLITALLTFVPYIGPALSFVVAAAVAAGEGGQAVVTVIAIYAAVQFVESYLITPLVQQKAVSMPPALLIAAQVVMGVLVGAVGVAVATPLAVVVIVLVQMLYVEGVLGDDLDVMGN